jgi:hexosaminidase
MVKFKINKMQQSPRLLKLCWIILLPFIFSCQNQKNNEVTPGIIPKPDLYVDAKGYFRTGTNLQVSYTDPSIVPVLKTFAGQLEKKIKIDLTGNQEGDIVVIIDKKETPGKEDYLLNIEPKKITIRANSKRGIFYGLQSLRQLIIFGKNNNGKIKIHCCSITDSPRFAWRGIMIDESRHFFGMKKIKQLLDIMSLHKLNVFHWHLTDSPGWRIEIKKYPKLTEVGGKGNFHDPDAPVTFYTQDEIKEIVNYAAERFIDVVPEIDMPGHATAANRAYPEYSGGGSERYPDFTFNPGKEETYSYLTNIIKEIAALFPSTYFHTGGDEVNYGNQQWPNIPAVKKLMKKEKIADLKGVETYFNKRIADTIISLNKKLIGWDEIVDTGLDPMTSVAMWWRHDQTSQLLKALENKYPVVLCPRIPLYFDFVQYETHKVGRRSKSGLCNLETIYDFPVDTLSGFIKYNDQILGIQANVWTEQIQNEERFDFMIYPRISALAESAWTKSQNKSYADFKGRLKSMLSYFDENNIKYFNPFNPELTPEPQGIKKN